MGQSRRFEWGPGGCAGPFEGPKGDKTREFAKGNAKLRARWRGVEPRCAGDTDKPRPEAEFGLCERMHPGLEPVGESGYEAVRTDD